MTPARREAEPSQPRVILVDRTSLGQTGGTGDDWRVQLASDLVEGRLVHVQVGDRHEAETRVGLPGRAGARFVGDRGVARAPPRHSPGGGGARESEYASGRV